MATAPVVENLPVPAPAPVTTLALQERQVKALEDQARAMERAATGAAQTAIAIGGISDVGGPKAERFERVLRACIEGRVATDVEGFLKFTRELCDGIDREFPEPTATP